MTPLALSLFGFGVLASAWLSLLVRGSLVPVPVVAILAGLALGWLVDAGQVVARHRALVDDVVTFVLIVAVMAGGLAIDRPFGLRRWGSAWRLLAIAMPITVLGIALAGEAMMGVPFAVAMLLGGILAPTDPVLARAVQVGPPGTGEEGEVRFALTSEAGLNDGLAFPFVVLGLAMIAHPPGAPWSGLLMDWAIHDLLWRTALDAATGIGLAWLLVAVGRRLPAHLRLPASDNGFVALGLALMVYGVADLLGGYGLVAVFAAAATLRNIGRALDFEKRLHVVAEHAEQVAMVLVLVAFGAAIAGGLLAPLTWWDAALGIVLLLVIRPAACLLALAGSALPWRERVVIGLLGMRGLGSFFYMAYATMHGLPDAWHARLWCVIGFVVLVSAVVHGAGARRLLWAMGAEGDGGGRD